MKICICSSFKFYKKVLKLQKLLTKNDLEVLVPIPNQFLHLSNNTNLKPSKKIVEEYWKHLTNHLNRIDQADLVYILSENGYIGNGVSLEIGYAYSKGKKIYSSEKIKDLPVSCFIEKIVCSEKLIKNLNP